MRWPGPHRRLQPSQTPQLTISFRFPVLFLILYAAVVAQAKLVVDTRGATKKLSRRSEKIVTA